MFPKILVALVVALGVSSSHGAVVAIKECSITKLGSATIAGKARILKDGDAYKVGFQVTTLDTSAKKLFLNKASSKPAASTAQTGDDVQEVTGFTFSTVGSEQVKAWPASSTVSNADVKHITITGEDTSDVRGVCTLDDSTTTSAASMLTIPVLAAAGLILSLTL